MWSFAQKLLKIAICGPIACAASRPAWFPAEAYVERASASDRFLVAGGEARGESRAGACDAAHAQAVSRLGTLLEHDTETRPDVVAAAGGPSRFGRAIATFVEKDAVRAQRTQEAYDDPSRRCWVEVRWLLPRQLAAAVRRAVEGGASELGVALEMRRALEGSNGATSAPTIKRPASYPTPAAAVSAAYPGWFFRVLPVPGCATHTVVFVGAPGGAEARWLELREREGGWLIVGDDRAPNEGWPESAPPIPACD